MEGVASGAIRACRYVRLAVKRHGDDLAASNQGRWVYDPALGRKACQFIETLHHVKGDLARTNVTLEPWQCWIVCMLFGWIDRETGRRRFRRAYLELPRKNGKTILGAAIGLYMFVGLGEMGAECYTAASKLDQAAICFKMARQMVVINPPLRDVFDIRVTGGASYAGVLTLPDDSVFSALPKDLSGSLDGLNPHFALLDEIHSYQTSDVYDAMRLGMGSRASPLLLGITTAGFGLGGVGHMHSKRTADMLEGKITLERQFGVIYTIDDPDRWRDPEAWAEANPNYGVSVSQDYMEEQAEEAISSAESQRGFMTKNLNVWLGADSTWLNIADFDACTTDLPWETFAGCPCWIAFDLSETDDLTAIAYVFLYEGRLHVKVRSYAPRLKIEQKAQYREYEKAGWLEACEGMNGAAIDHDQIFDQIREDRTRFDVRRVIYDPWHARQMASRIANFLRLPAVKMEQTARNFSRPMREVVSAMADRAVVIEANPALRWMIGNVVALRDTLGRMRPSRNDSGDKIDAAVALLMAYSMATVESGYIGDAA